MWLIELQRVYIKCQGLHAVSALLGAVFGVLEAFVWMVVITVLLHTPLFKKWKLYCRKFLIKQVNQVTEMVAKDYLGPLFSSEVSLRWKKIRSH